MDVYKELHFFPILVADDDPFQRRLVRHTLNSIGYKDIEEADSGLSALKMIKCADFALIFSDVEMPGINGLELLQHVRCGNTLTPRDTRFIIFTSFSNMTILRASIALDVNGFLAKPLKTGAMRDNIRKAMNEPLHLKSENMYQTVSTDISETHTAPPETKQRIVQPQPPKKAPPTIRSVIPKPSAPPPVVPQKSEAQSKSEEQMPDGALKMSLLQLKPGLILMQNVVAKDGALLLAAGSILSQLIIHRLHELREILSSEQFWVATTDNVSQDSSGESHPPSLDETV